MPLRVLVVAMLLALLAGGCMADGPSEEEDRALARAADRLAKETSARYKFDLDAKTEQDGELAFRGNATSNADSTRARMKGDMKVEGNELPVDMIVRDNRAWMRSPGLAELLPAGKRWVLLADDSPTQSMTFDQFVEMLRASDNVWSSGGPRVGGRATTHFKARVSIDELLDHAPPEARAQYEQYQGLSAEIPLEAWIDDEGLLRRVKVDLEEGEQRMKYTVEFVEYGVEVDAAEPPAAQVVDESALG